MKSYKVIIKIVQRMSKSLSFHIAGGIQKRLHRDGAVQPQIERKLHLGQLRGIIYIRLRGSY